MADTFQVHARYIAGLPEVNAKPGSERRFRPYHRTQHARASIRRSAMSHLHRLRDADWSPFAPGVTSGNYGPYLPVPRTPDRRSSPEGSAALP
jgi:hypothetical protein